MKEEEKKSETEQIPNLKDKEFQDTETIGTINKVFEYWTKEGRSRVAAEATIPDVPTLEGIEKNCTSYDGKGVPRVDNKKQAREIVKLVYGLDGTSLQNIIRNHGATLYNQMRTFAFELSGIVMSSDEIETEKN